jgi:hypothetical protein
MYWVANGATITLPAATVLGQQMILSDVVSTNSSAFTLRAAGSDTIFDEQGGSVTSLGGSIMIDGTAFIVSDGANHWYTIYHN